jgi:hypothetical protein
MPEIEFQRIENKVHRLNLDSVKINSPDLGGWNGVPDLGLDAFVPFLLSRSGATAYLLVAAPWHLPLVGYPRPWDP